MTTTRRFHTHHPIAASPCRRWEKTRPRRARRWPRLPPSRERFDVRRGPIAEPAIELGLVLQLLPPQARHDDEPGIEFGECGEVAPELLELGDGEDVFLPCPQRFFTSLSVT
jgi:hypothetical protein